MPSEHARKAANDAAMLIYARLPELAERARREPGAFGEIEDTVLRIVAPALEAERARADALAEKLDEIRDASGPASGLLERPEATWLREAVRSIPAQRHHNSAAKDSARLAQIEEELGAILDEAGVQSAVEIDEEGRTTNDVIVRVIAALALKDEIAKALAEMLVCAEGDRWDEGDHGPINRAAFEAARAALKANGKGA